MSKGAENMRIKIKNDKNEVIGDMFNDNMKTHNYIKTQVVLYLLYGENTTWKYQKEADTFELRRNGKVIKTLTHEEWIEMFRNHSISINDNRTLIQIRTDDNSYENKFISLLDKYEVEYKVMTSLVL